MKRFLARGAAIVAVFVGLSACGGSGTVPTTPTAATPTATPVPTPTPAGTSAHIEVIDGVSGTAVSTGEYGVASGPFSTFSGAFDASPVGADLIVAVPGYLRRMTSLPTSGRLNLWPAGNATEEEYVRRLVFVNAVDNATERGLFRLPFGTYRVALSAEVDTAQSRAVLDRVFARLADVTHGAVTLSLTSGSPLVTMSVDSSITPFGGFTNWSAVGGYIATGTVRLVSQSRSVEEGLLLHEFGHMIGLQHSNRTEDVMNSAARVQEFTSRERSVVTMMFQRSAGTRFPDSDIGTTFRSALDSSNFACGR